MKLWVIIGLLGLNSSLFAVQKAIYGVDNRYEVEQLKDPFLEGLADSTAGRIHKYLLRQTETDDYRVYGYSLGMMNKLCYDERFYSQLAPLDCSGFLVAPDLLVTAGHCMMMPNACEDYYWVFGYQTVNGKAKTSVSGDDVYRCKEILDLKPTNAYEFYVTQNDYALIRLDREVAGREPLKVRTSGKISEDAPLVVIGHPSGLPTKVTPGGFVRDNSNPVWFSTNLDTFQGSSGSPVIDAQTGLVEGILVRGGDDYIIDSANKCRRAATFAMDEGRGEDATRITNLTTLMELLK